MASLPDSEEQKPASSTSELHHGSWMSWIGSLILGLVLLISYSANERDLGSYDTVPTTMMLLTMARGEGVYLDRYRPILRDKGRVLPVFVAPYRGRILSRYPVAPAILDLPLVVPQVALLDWLHPGWDRDPRVAFNECKWMGKRSMALLMALTTVILYRFLLGLGLGRAALLSALAAGLGSNFWCVGSQAVWQHGPAAFTLTAAIVLLHSTPVSRWRLILAGLATAFLFASRLIDGLFAAVIVLWVTRSQPAGLLWLLPAPLIGAIALLSYNLWFFWDLVGGQAQLELIHRDLHRLPGPWSGNLLQGAMGTLFSPNRGLFVFTPWVAVALAATPLIARRLASCRLMTWLLLALVPYLLLLSKYAVWWGGHCFGPRYWTDVIPLFAILLAFGLNWAMGRSRGLTALFIVTIIVAIVIQIIGACFYPSNWNLEPLNVDLHHERLWDWRDTELSRCLSKILRQYLR
jgi:hypothetical protein